MRYSLSLQGIMDALNPLTNWRRYYVISQDFRYGKYKHFWFKCNAIQYFNSEIQRREFPFIFVYDLFLKPSKLEQYSERFRIIASYSQIARDLQ